MMDLDTAYINYMNSRKTAINETLIWIIGRNRSTDAEHGFGFYTGDRAPLIEVPRADTGALVMRQYYGQGSIVGNPIIAESPSFSELNAITFDFNATDDYVTTELRAYNLRNARVEVHWAYRDQASNNLVAAPFVMYRGQTDGLDSTQSGSSLDGKSSDIEILSLTVIPAVRAMVVNTKTRSEAYSIERSGDKIYQYCGVAHKWPVWWGKKHKSHGGNSSGKGKKGDGKGGGGGGKGEHDWGRD